MLSRAVVARVGEVGEASGGVGLETGEGDSIDARRGLWGVVSSAGKRGEEDAGYERVPISSPLKSSESTSHVFC